VVFSHSLGADLSMVGCAGGVSLPGYRVLRYIRRGHGEFPSAVLTIYRRWLGMFSIYWTNLSLPRCVVCGLSLGGLTGFGWPECGDAGAESGCGAAHAAKIGTQES